MWKYSKGEEGTLSAGAKKKNKNKKTERERIWVKGSNGFLKDLFESVMPKHLV